ncbi:MAG: MBL fold metallo-hydrolase [Eubacterium sp.]|nr:MBL fold metallo-hydrolase [Eubacterium sp.]
MRLASIASGSSGNCIYVGNDKTQFLVDLGISCKRITEGMREMDLDPGKLSGVFITHEHVDHIQGLGVFLRKYKIPVFATASTIDRILSVSSLGKLDKGLFEIIRPDQPIEEGGIRIEASSVLHDAADPVCYTFSDPDAKVGIATDFGTFDDYLVEKMKGCQSLLVEANHDLNMLMVGPYPYPLKRRIMGNKGHMSNERAGQFLSKVIDEGTRNIFLGHLSKENNYAELAYETVKVELSMHNIDPDKRKLSLVIAKRSEPTYL